MEKLKSLALSFYLKITGSLAFMPTLITMGLVLISLICLNYNFTELRSFLQDNATYLLVDHIDTARALLTTIIGGILSLTVFSFSMVMIILNQASTNFSPRLLPSLIENKNNQIVLGIFLGTIFSNILILMSVSPMDELSYTNAIPVLYGIIMALVSLAMFVVFIQTVSAEIQIVNILERIYTETKNRLIRLQEYDHSQNGKSSITFEFIVSASNSGYFQGIRKEDLLSLIDQLDCNLKVLPYEGMYILKGDPLFQTDKKLSTEDKEKLQDYMIIGKRSLENNFLVGIKQLTEVGLKAMSPGVNDPGTAIITLDYLSNLLRLRMQLADEEYFASKEKTDKVIQLNRVHFEDLLYQCMVAYRQYCKHDIILIQRLIQMLLSLRKSETNDNKYYEVIDNNLDLIEMDAQNSIDNKYDLDLVIKMRAA